MNRPCSIALPTTTCPGSDSPILNVSAEAPDGLYFAGISYSPFPPWAPSPIGGGMYVASDCSGVTFNVASQEVADLLAAINAELCGSTGLDPGINPVLTTPVYNGPQTAVGGCSSLATFSLTVPAGQFAMVANDPSQVGATQAAVDAQALAYAQQRVAQYDYCAACSVPSGKVAMCLDTPFISSNLFTVRGSTGGGFHWTSSGLPPGISISPGTTTAITDSIGDTWVAIGGGRWMNLTDGTIQSSQPSGTNTSNTGTCDLVGTPTQAGNFNFTVTATAANGLSSTTFSGVCSVLGFGNTSPLPNSYICNLVNIPLLANGGTGPYTFSFDPWFGAPADLDISNGTMHGQLGVGTYALHLVVTDHVGQQCSKLFSLTVTPSDTQPAFTTSSPLPNAHVGRAYFQSIGVSGGCPIPGKLPPYIITVDSGSLPPGSFSKLMGGDQNVVLWLDDPSPVGTYSFTLKAVDNVGQSVLRTFSLTIDTDAVVTGSCVNNGAIFATGMASQVSPGVGWRPTAAAETTQANAINDLITNLNALGCTCPPLSPTIDQIGANSILTNTSATCTIECTCSYNFSPFGIAPGGTYNPDTQHVLQTGSHLHGVNVTITLGGGVSITIHYP